MGLRILVPNPEHPEVFYNVVVGRVLGRTFTHWPADAPDIEIEPAPRRGPGRPSGNIKPDGALEITPTQFAVIEVESTTEPS